jgi:hypothetical protein
MFKIQFTNQNKIKKNMIQSFNNGVKESKEYQTCDCGFHSSFSPFVNQIKDTIKIIAIPQLENILYLFFPNVLVNLINEYVTFYLELKYVIMTDMSLESPVITINTVLTDNGNIIFEYNTNILLNKLVNPEYTKYELLSTILNYNFIKNDCSDTYNKINFLNYYMQTIHNKKNYIFPFESSLDYQYEYNNNKFYSKLTTYNNNKKRIVVTDRYITNETELLLTVCTIRKLNKIIFKCTEKLEKIYKKTINKIPVTLHDV